MFASGEEKWVSRTQKQESYFTTYAFVPFEF